MVAGLQGTGIGRQASGIGHIVEKNRRICFIGCDARKTEAKDVERWEKWEGWKVLPVANRQLIR